MRFVDSSGSLRPASGGARLPGLRFVSIWRGSEPNLDLLELRVASEVGQSLMESRLDALGRFADPEPPRPSADLHLRGRVGHTMRDEVCSSQVPLGNILARFVAGFSSRRRPRLPGRTPSSFILHRKNADRQPFPPEFERRINGSRGGKVSVPIFSGTLS